MTTTTKSPDLTINQAREALLSLKDFIDEKLTDLTNASDDPDNGAIGYKPGDDAEDWLHNEDDRDGFLRKLVNAGLCLP